jgi:hypothetical protein
MKRRENFIRAYGALRIFPFHPALKRRAGLLTKFEASPQPLKRQ